jgi:4-hydroxythreonine-4-phosphate dehydrogenase
VTPPIVVTAGEPAGIGPDIVLALAQTSWPTPLAIISNKQLLADRAKQLGVTVNIIDYNGQNTCGNGCLAVIDVPLKAPVTPGQLNPDNATHVLDCLTLAADGCLNNQYRAIVTAAVHKGLINDAGIAFTGHTDFFKQRSKSQRVVMFFESAAFKLGLATTHLPLADVAGALTQAQLEQTLEIMHHALKTQYKIATPRIGVLGLNPHAGESGHLGREEITIIQPVINSLRQQGFLLSDPLPADTAFLPTHLSRYDAYLSMYHDQALPVLKHLGFDSAVNVSLGLPFVRTSVDHGTALTLAGTGKAAPQSLLAAVQSAAFLSQPQTEAALS